MTTQAHLNRPGDVMQLAARDQLPPEIEDAFRRVVRGWLLANYIGDRKCLTLWNDHYAHISSILSVDVKGMKSSRALWLLRLQVERGLLTERPRKWPHQVVQFDMPRAQLDAIAAEETARYQAMGYVIGEIVPEIKEQGVSQ